MKSIAGIVFFLNISLISLSGQGKLLTVAEKSGFKSTSEHSSVLEFIDSLTKISENIRVESIGKTSEGRDIPLLVIGNPLPLSPESIRNDSRIVVYIQCNIHAGEVEGKEASLMFARDLLKSEAPELLRNAIILICPDSQSRRK